jgi:hypothetical protein
MLDDVAVYLVLSPIAAIVVLVLGVVGWSMRRLSPAAPRRAERTNSHRLSE